MNRRELYFVKEGLKNLRKAQYLNDGLISIAEVIEWIEMLKRV